MLALLAYGNAQLWLETIPLCLLLCQCVVGLLAPEICWGEGPSMQMLSIPAESGSSRCRHPVLLQLLGRWRMQERHHMDEFLEGLGFNGIVRALLTKAGQEQVISYSEEGDKMRVITSDLRGTSELELPLSGKAVLAHDGDGGADVCRSASIDRGTRALVITESAPNEKQPISVCTRTMQDDGRMCIDIQKRALNGRTYQMKAIFVRDVGV